ncbi:MAG: thioesterase family protein [Candidatus Binatia bacterium]
MHYKLERRLSHADVDFLGELKVPAFLGLLEQAAVEASTAAGFDAAWYTRESRTWIIHRTRLERFVPVGGTDTVAVDTEIIDFRRARSLRRYEICRDAIRVATATTDWVYCELANGRPMRIPEAMQRVFMSGAAGVALPRARPLPGEGPGVPVELTVTVRPSHLDHVVHVNNAVYASFLEDGAFALFATRGWPLPRMLAASGALRIRWLDFEYLSDAQVGTQLTVRSWLRDEQAFAADSEQAPRAVELLQTITRAEGATVMRAATHWVWRHPAPIVGAAPSA